MVRRSTRGPYELALGRHDGDWYSALLCEPEPLLPVKGHSASPCGSSTVPPRRSTHPTHGGTPMKLEGQEESANVEDRRGIGVKGGAAMGGGALILVLVVSLLFHK